MKRLLMAALLLFFTVLLFQVAEAKDKDIEKGEKLIKKYNCRICHRIDGKGGSIGPKLYGVIEKKGEDYVVRFVRGPKPKKNTIMPDFPMSNEEIKTLITYLEKAKK